MWKILWRSDWCRWEWAAKDTFVAMCGLSRCAAVVIQGGVEKHMFLIKVGKFEYIHVACSDEGWRKDGFGRELDPQSCTTGKSIPVCGLTDLTELASDFSISFHLAGLKMLSLTYIHVGIPIIIYMKI